MFSSLGLKKISTKIIMQIPYSLQQLLHFDEVQREPLEVSAKNSRGWRRSFCTILCTNTGFQNRKWRTFSQSQA